MNEDEKIKTTGLRTITIPLIYMTQDLLKKKCVLILLRGEPKTS